KISNLRLVFKDPNKQYDGIKDYDYVVVNYYHVLREEFDDSGIKSNYRLIHQVTVDNVPLVNIYEK
ncbi:MAG: hypothetical protein M1444_04080, partial [Patescibacteria group bacterium]|nr:hypothetical protein [Patescibacteria group bacterium]